MSQVSGSDSQHVRLVYLRRELLPSFELDTSLSASGSNELAHVSNRLVSTDEKQSLKLVPTRSLAPFPAS